MPTQDATRQVESPDEESALLPDRRREPGAEPPDLVAESPDAMGQWLELAMIGPRSASGTVRRFVETIDRVVPLDEAGLSKRRQAVAAALEMTQRLVRAPHGLARSFVQSAVLVNVEVDVDIASPRSTTGVEQENE